MMSEPNDQQDDLPELVITSQKFTWGDVLICDDKPWDWAALSANPSIKFNWGPVDEV